jgi:hypothetical protein
MTRARLNTGVRDQAGNARSAEATAAATSAAEDIATSAHFSPVAESYTAALLPLLASRRSPSIQLDTLRIDFSAVAFSAMIVVLSACFACSVVQ